GGLLETPQPRIDPPPAGRAARAPGRARPGDTALSGNARFVLPATRGTVEDPAALPVHEKICAQAEGTEVADLLHRDLRTPAVPRNRQRTVTSIGCLF